METIEVLRIFLNKKCKNYPISTLIPLMGKTINSHGQTDKMSYRGRLTLKRLSCNVPCIPMPVNEF